MISSLRLQNFRLYKDESFEFEPGVNIVVGPNTAGKTTLLEAITVLATGSSYKARDGALIRHGAPWARADGFFKGGNRTVKIVSQGELTIKDFVVAERPYKRLSLERSVPIVLFEPEQLQLLSRGPEQRREYFEFLPSVMPYSKEVRAAAPNSSLLGTCGLANWAVKSPWPGLGWLITSTLT